MTLAVVLPGCGLFPFGPQAEPLGSGLPGAGLIYGICVDGGNLYAAGSAVSSGVAKWDGTTWTSLTATDSHLSDAPLCVAVYNGALYAGGAFVLVDSMNLEITRNIVRWNGTSWEAVANGIDGRVNALTVFNNELIAAGSFANAGGSPAANVARWNNTSWAAAGSGLDGEVRALAVYDGKLVAAGALPNYAYVAVWNGGPWGRLGGPGTSGPNGQVKALAVFGGELYVGGAFNILQGQDAKNIGKWTGSGWSPVGRIINGTVADLGVHDGAIFAGGNFTTTDAGSANRLARWDGSRWQPVGSGVSGGMGPQILDLAEYNGKLVTAGSFASANGRAATNIALWSP